jgi:hypothetical protein
VVKSMRIDDACSMRQRHTMTSEGKLERRIKKQLVAAPRPAEMTKSRSSRPLTRSIDAAPPAGGATAEARQPEPKVALRISLIARRCSGDSPGKARFDCVGGALIVEDLVLRRWRQRRSPDETFHGCRLPPRT